MLGSPFHPDLWRDCGVLGMRDPSLLAQRTTPLTLREFIAEAHAAYGFHRWALVLIGLFSRSPMASSHV